MRLLDNGDGNHRIDKAWTENGNQNQGQQQAGKSENDVHYAHDKRIYFSSEVAGHKTQNNTNDKRYRNHHAADK